METVIRDCLKHTKNYIAHPYFYDLCEAMNYSVEKYDGLIKLTKEQWERVIEVVRKHITDKSRHDKIIAEFRKILNIPEDW